MSEDKPGVPKQVVGGSHNNSATRCFDTIAEAEESFQILKNRFLEIGCWQDYMGKLGATFSHIDIAGNVVHRSPIAGDYIQINMPGPDNIAGDGFDWVKIVEVDEKSYDVDDRMLIRCVPATNPASEKDDIAHFYTERASSTFVILRDKLCLKAEVYGRNEITNIEVDHLADKVRNKMISVGGSLGLSKMQWTSFAKSILKF